MSRPRSKGINDAACARCTRSLLISSAGTQYFRSYFKKRLSKSSGLDKIFHKAIKCLKYLIIYKKRFYCKDIWLRKITRIPGIARVRLQPRLPIRIIHRTVVAGVAWRIAASFLRPNIFPREETCGIVAAAPIAGGYNIKRSGKSLNAAKCLKKSIQTAEAHWGLDSVSSRFK